MNKTVFKVLDDKGRVVIPAPIRASLGIASGDVVAITPGRGSITVKKAIVLEDFGVPARAQRSGSCGERSRSGMSEFCPCGRNERYAACDDAPMDAKIAYAETVAREMDDDALTDLLGLAVRLLQERKSKP